MPITLGQTAITFPDNSTQATAVEVTGMVCPFAANTTPTGWLSANGAAVSRTTYSRLFAAIGTAFGVGDGSTTFNLPDLRGEFIRGWDAGRGVQSRTFGSWEGAYSGSFYVQCVQDDGDSQYGSYRSVSSVWFNGIQYVNLGNGEGTVYVTPGDSRPRNVALHYCIKY